MPFTPVSQSLTGSGTAASPYRVTTVVTGDPSKRKSSASSVHRGRLPTSSGNNFYRTDVTVANIERVEQSSTATLYHAADCQLRGNDNGFRRVPAAELAEHSRLHPERARQAAVCDRGVRAPHDHNRSELGADTSLGLPGLAALWADLNGSALQNSCLQCRGTAVDTGIGIAWPVSGLAAGALATFSFQTVIVDTVPAGGFSFAGPAGSTVGGTVATITDPNTSATPSAYSATINWGDGSSSAGTVGGGNGSFSVTGNHSYVAGGTYPITVTITAVGTNQGSSTVSRLRHDHGRSIHRDHGRPDRQQQHEGRFRWVGESGRPPDHDRTSSTGSTRAIASRERPVRSTTTRRRLSRWARTSRATRCRRRSRGWCRTRCTTSGWSRRTPPGRRTAPT